MRVTRFTDHVAQQLARATYSRQRRSLPWITVGLGLLTALVLLATLAQHPVPSGLWWVAGALAVVTALSAAATALVERAYFRDREVRERLIAGLAGQYTIPRYLAGLDDRYYLLSNLNLPGRGDDIDHLVVGPTGLFALEVKHHRGRIFWRDGQWVQAKTSQSGRTQPEEPLRDPVQQLKRNVEYLRRCINNTDRPLSRRAALWIEGAVVFTHTEVRLDLPDTLLAGLPFSVLQGHDLAGYVTGNRPRRPLGHAQVCRIVSLLAHLQLPSRPEGRRAQRAGRFGLRRPMRRHPSTSRAPGRVP